MSGLNIQNSRIQQKYSTFSGETPTIAPSTDHTDGTWTPTDLYVGEVFFNVVDDAAWFRSLNGIVPLTSGASYVSTYVNITGGTMTGGLVTPSLSATSITGTTIYSPNFNGVFVGNGSGLTGITATVFSGGTVPNPVTFEDRVYAEVGINTDSIFPFTLGAPIELDSDAIVGGYLNVIGNISGNTFYGDGSGLTNLPSLTAVTLNSVLTQGDTSTNGNIVLTNGDMTLTNGTFFGDGSGLTNVPFGPTPTLDEVLLSGNTSTNGDILLTNGDIVLGTGSYYGDGSGLTNLPTPTATTQTLAEVLINGNTTDGNDIILNIGDKIKTPDGTAFSTLNTDLFRGASNNGIGQAGTLDVESGSVLMYASDSATTITTEIASSAAGAGGNVMTVSDGVDVTIITQTALGITVTNPYASSPGIQYAGDYRTGFTNNTLVTKQYVDAATSGSSSTLAQVLANGNITGANNIVFNQGQKIVHSGQTGTSINFTADTVSPGIKKVQIQGVGDNGFGKVGVDNEGVVPIVRMQTSNNFGGSADIFMISEDATIVADATNSISLLSNSTNGVTIDGGMLTNTYTVNDGADATEIYQTPLQITVTNPYASSPGIQYAADYSADFVDETLVTKRYVDAAVSGNTLEQVLTNGNNTGVNNIVLANNFITEYSSAIVPDNMSGLQSAFSFELNGGLWNPVILASDSVGITQNFTNATFKAAEGRILSRYDNGVTGIGSIETYGDVQVGNDRVELSAGRTAGSSSLFTAIYLTPSGTTASGELASFKGIEYFADYSANFTNRSLVDKEYVDNAVAGGGAGTLNQVLTNGNSTGGENIDLTIGDKILFTPASGSTLGSTSGETKLYVVDNANENYTVKIEGNFDNGGGDTVLVTHSVDNVSGVATEITQNGSGQNSYVYNSINGNNGYSLYVRNQTTNNGYWFYTQNEGYSPGGGGEATYGVKSYEWIGSTFKVQKSRSAELATGNSQVMWRSESLSTGHIAQYTINVFGRVPSDSSQAQTSTIKFAVGWATNKLPYLIGTEIVEAFSTFSVVDYTISLDTTVNAGRVLLTLTNTESFSIDYSVRVEELAKEPVTY